MQEQKGSRERDGGIEKQGSRNEYEWGEKESGEPSASFSVTQCWVILFQAYN